MILIASCIILNAEILTLNDAKKMSLERNPELLAQEQSTKAAEADFWNSTLSFIPSATLTGNYLEFGDGMKIGMDTAENSKSYGFSITQPIFNGGKIWLGSRLTNDLYKISRETYFSKRLSTIAEVESKYFSVLQNETLLEITRKNLQSAQTNLEIAKVRFESGSLSKADYLQLQSEKASKEVNLIQMENLYQTSLLDLANFLQIPEVYELTPVPVEEYQVILDFLQTRKTEDIDRLIQEVTLIGMENNPFLKMSALSVETKKKSLLMAEGNFLPSVNLYYSKNWSKYDFDDDYNSSDQIGVNLSIPVFPLADNGLGVVSARHNLKGAKYNYESAEDGIKLGLKSLVMNLVAAAKTVHSGKLAEQYAEETYNQMKERFATGLITANDLLSAEVMFTSAQNQYATSLYDFLRAKSGLLQQMGVEDEQVLLELLSHKER